MPHQELFVWCSTDSKLAHQVSDKTIILHLQGLSNHFAIRIIQSQCEPLRNESVSIQQNI